jgi:UDP:flavonoid glycosyltransferase YjiC (YdhE family)
MKTILVFPFNIQAHYLRCLVLAEQYDRRDYKILFIESSNYGRYAEEQGYETFRCTQLNPDRVMACARKFDFSWLDQADLETILAGQVSAIKKYNADIVIGDVSPTLKMAAEIAGVKYVSLLNGYMTKYYALTRGVSKRILPYKLLKKLPLKLSDSITNFAERIAFRYVHRPFRELRKKYALSRTEDYLSELEGDENIICDYEYLFPQKPLPGHYRIIGPLIYRPRQSEGSWLSSLEQDRPVICVCMGSTGDWTRLQFLNDPYYNRYTIITAGDTGKLLSAPHIISRDFVNLNQVLKKADLMICHGGNGTLYTGLMNGVFMLCVSSNFEQEWNISALQRNGHGKSADGLSDSGWKTEIINSLSNLQLYCDLIKLSAPKLGRPDDR